MSVLGKRWVQRYERPKGESLWSAMLAARNVENPGWFFSSATLADLHDPFLFKDMHKAVDRLLKAIPARERIVVYGDYDVDGTSGSALLIHTLRFLGAEVSYRIPHRRKDGYGLHSHYVEELAEKGVSLLITVDLGISCVKEVALAQSKNIDVIITDHHTIPPKLPEAFAIIHPGLDENYPWKYLAGSGVAFKLAQALLIQSGNADFVAHLVDLASLGTVADCVPLLGENRTLVKLGLKQLERTKWEGLEAILANAGVFGKGPYTSETIGFQIGPRINAAGRMDDPYWALNTLISEGASAQKNSQRLESLNQERKDLTETILQEAEAGLDLSKPILIAMGKWSSGVVGLIAGRLQEKYGKPTFILEDQGGKLVGSARSVPGYHAVAALQHAASLLEAFGGHELAAGFHLLPENFDAFRESLYAHSELHFKENPHEMELNFDCEITAEDLEMGIADRLQNFAPFGISNPYPLFRLRGARVLQTRPVGSKKEHLKVDLQVGDKLLSGIAFRFAEHVARLEQATDFLVNLETNEWNGSSTLQVKVVDVE